MNFVFRADASIRLGYGHVMRCLALADKLRQHGMSCLFVCSPDGTALAEEVATRGHRLLPLPMTPADEEEDAEATLQLVARCGAIRAFVLDHYGLGKAWETRVRSDGALLLVIDDAPRPHHCDSLLDQNVLDGDNPYRYCISDDCSCLLGPRYALLRPEFQRLRIRAPTRDAVHRALVFFGGTDPHNETGKALKGLMAERTIRSIDVVIGASNPHRALLEALCSSGQHVRLHVQTSAMADLMARADVAIGAAGSASWERCCLRLPAVVSILAENQSPIAGGLARAGAAINLGDASRLGPDDYAAAVARLDGAGLAAMSEAAGVLVDGLGSERVAKEFERLSEERL